MTLTAKNANRVSAAIYVTLSLAAGVTFFLVTVAAGEYSWVSRIGGGLWVAALTLIILMPTVTPIVMARATGGKVEFASHDHDAMMREEMMRNEQPHEDERSVEMAKDPVCGMDVDPATAAGSSEYKGETIYFCALSCKKSFDEDPEKYMTAS